MELINLLSNLSVFLGSDESRELCNTKNISVEYSLLLITFHVPQVILSNFINGIANAQRYFLCE